jgi:hypothetical protein
VPPRGAAVRAAGLLFGNDLEHRSEAPEPELLGVLAPFVDVDGSHTRVTAAGTLYSTRGPERPIGAELRNGVGAVAQRLAREVGSSLTLRAFDRVLKNTPKPLARPVGDEAVNLATPRINGRRSRTHG